MRTASVLHSNGDGYDFAVRDGRIVGVRGRAEDRVTLVGFITSIIPTTLVSPLVGESVLSTLFGALLIGFAVQALGSTGEAALRGSRCSRRSSSRCSP